MTSTFAPLDYVVFVIYAFAIIGLGLWVSRTKKGTEKSAQDYFLADRGLTWWAIGASLIAANISAEHFIAMSGSGYAVGLGIAAYEWIAAIVLIFVAKYLLPVFLEKRIYTMPEFLKQRFNQGVSSAFAIFWLLVYVFVNLASVTYLGALAMKEILGTPLLWGIAILALISGVYSVYGGLKAVAWTDVIQVIFLVGGGLVTTFITLDAVAGPEGGILKGFGVLFTEAGDHFNMIIEKGDIIVPDGKGGTKDAFIDLPGLAVIFGAMWITNFGYWGFNQYIIQKGLAAKDLRHAKQGLLFGAYLKILIPLIVIIPGITAFVFVTKYSPAELSQILNIPIEEMGWIHKSDEAYPWLLKNFVPVGVRGLAFAALVAAIVSSLASMLNSTSTIFTMDIYKVYFKKNASNKDLVRVGRIVAFVALIIAVAFAPLLSNLDQAFQYIQEYTGYIYPGVVVVFFIGLFWKQASGKAALWTAIVTIPLGALIKILFPEMPFILRMGYVFIALCFIAAAISFLDKKNKVKAKKLPDYKVKRATTTGTVLIIVGLVAAIAGIIFTPRVSGMGIESIFMFATMLIMLGLINIWNVKILSVEKEAISVNPKIFKTGPVFFVGAVGIVLIIGGLYALFW